VKFAGSLAIIALGVLLAVVAGVSTIGWLIAGIGVIFLLATLVFVANNAGIEEAEPRPDEKDPFLGSGLTNKL